MCCLRHLDRLPTAGSGYHNASLLSASTTQFEGFKLRGDALDVVVKNIFGFYCADM